MGIYYRPASLCKCVTGATQFCSVCADTTLSYEFMEMTEQSTQSHIQFMHLVRLNTGCVAYDGIRNGISSCRTRLKFHRTYFSSVIPRRYPSALRQTFYLRYTLSLFISLEFFFPFTLATILLCYISFPSISLVTLSDSVEIDFLSNYFSKYRTEVSCF